MAAEQKAVESTAEEILQKEDHSMVKEEASVTDRAVHSVRALKETASVTDLADLLARTQRDHVAHSAKARRDHAELSVIVLREDHSVRIQKEEASATDHADHSVRVLRAEVSVTDHADHSARARTEEATAKEEASATESQADSR